MRAMSASPNLRSATDSEVAFSHVQLYVDCVESLEVYKQFEEHLNEYDNKTTSSSPQSAIPDTTTRRAIWKSLVGESSRFHNSVFVPQNRDVVQQLLAGFGFRVTGYRIPSEDNTATTRSVLLTSRDPAGVQLIVTADHGKSGGATAVREDEYLHFDIANLTQFYDCHAQRQGIAVLGFQTNDVDQIYQRYQHLHPNLIHSYRSYKDSRNGDQRGVTKVLQVYAYYQEEGMHAGSDSYEQKRVKQADQGTLLRFVEASLATKRVCILPGVIEVPATFGSTTSQPAYCDHWVSNVFSRTEFLQTLQDTLGFAPKADFNAGVVAAGEAQIESTVTGNMSSFETGDKQEALKDQSQVYLPINNALSKVGHVHGFLEEIGQGIQHVASRVNNLVEFVQRCNDIREVTGEGFTFLNIPRSYYGILTPSHLMATSGISNELADIIMDACERNQIVSIGGAVDLSLGKNEIAQHLDASLAIDTTGYQQLKENIVAAILNSRYRNLYSLLRHHVSEEAYLGIVRNEILVDVQGEDILYQIFTCNILQREAGDEAPFLEFIQRVCSECESTGDGCPTKIKPGCGGFGIRNFLTLFLSIEVSKAMLEATDAKRTGNEVRRMYAQKRVDCFTSQLNDSNPILTDISDAMTEEGQYKAKLEEVLTVGEVDAGAIALWKERMKSARQRKQAGNAKLVECSARYKAMMRSIREAAE